MGALESKRWHELIPETPQKEKQNEKAQQAIEDPRSPSMHQPRTPIVLQEYEESPLNIVLRAEFCDPRSPSVKITRTPLALGSNAVVIVDEMDGGDVFESRERSTSDPPTPFSKTVDDSQVNSSGAPLIKKDAMLLKNTASPGDLKRKNRLRRRQSLPQKLFSEKKFATFPRSPLAQRNHSVPDDHFKDGKNKRFTLLPKKKSLVNEDFNDDKENTTMPIVR